MALVAGTRQFKGSVKLLAKRRHAIEPVIGQAKQQQALNRTFLRVRRGDRITALLSACGFNLRKLVRCFHASQPIASRSLP